MKKMTLLLAVVATMMVSTASAKDIRVVEISTGKGMSANYDSSIQSILKTVAGVSKVVSDVANLVLTVTYDADQISVTDIVGHINKKEPRFEAKQKGEPKTKQWVKAEQKRDKAEQKVEQERKEAQQRDQERKQQPAQDRKDNKKDNKKDDKKDNKQDNKKDNRQGAQGNSRH